MSVRQDVLVAEFEDLVSFEETVFGTLGVLPQTRRSTEELIPASLNGTRPHLLGPDLILRGGIFVLAYTIQGS